MAQPADALSWELPEALARASLVHLLHPFCRLGEMAMLLARLQCKPVCATAEARPNSLGAALDLLSLADAVVQPDESAERLAAVYQRLLAGIEEGAA
jgi:hypothetical protein